jgi:hypothetical protein
MTSSLNPLPFSSYHPHHDHPFPANKKEFLYQSQADTSFPDDAVTYKSKDEEKILLMMLKQPPLPPP